jgi:hypothetical protein
LSASGAVEDAGLLPDPDAGGVLVLQATPNPSDATTMNSLEALFI